MSERTDRLCRILADCAQRGRIVITGHDRADVDSVISCLLMKRLLDAWQIPAQVLLHEPDKQSQRVMGVFGVDVSALAGDTHQGDWLILLDHHQSAHAGTVAACVDHHPTDYPPECPYVQLEESGACAVMVLRLMQESGMRVTPEDERLAIAALYLDTIALRSAKLTRQEAAWGESEAKRLGLDEEWLRREGMGLRDMTLPARELAMLGRKVFVYGDKRVLSTYVQTNEMTPDRLDAILTVLKEEIVREQADLWVYLVHDPMAMRSMQYNIMPDGRVERIAHDYLASRGKNVMPRVEREMRAKGDRKDGR